MGDDVSEKSKIRKLCFKDKIFRNYYFLAEITFNRILRVKIELEIMELIPWNLSLFFLQNFDELQNTSSNEVMKNSILYICYIDELLRTINILKCH